MYFSGLGDGGIAWNEVTYLPTTINAGQDTYTQDPTYFDPSMDAAWLAAIGFKGNPLAGRRKIDVPMVSVGYGEQQEWRPGPLPDGWVWHPGGQSVSGGDPPWVEWTPVRQWERDNGLRQQYYWMGSNRYARYVDRNGNQVGPVVQTYKESKVTKIIGKAVQIVAGAMVAAGAVQAAAAVASAATAPAATAPAAAAPTATAAAPAAAVVAPATAVAPVVSAVAPSVATGGAVTGAAGAISSILPSAAAVAKAIPAVASAVKAVQAVQGRQTQVAAQQMPIAPPASMVSPPPSALVPGQSQFDPTIFHPQTQMPPWLIPALLGGGALLLVMMGRRPLR